MNKIERSIAHSVTIGAPAPRVWHALTTPGEMREWMGEPEMKLTITTDWKVGNTISIKGFHHLPFENKGTVLSFEPYRILAYNHLSSLSLLPDKPENYTSLTFDLTPVAGHTALTLTLRHFPTEAVLKHVDFYWKTTLEILKTFIEKQTAA